jgi:hypothetical protein
LNWFQAQNKLGLYNLPQLNQEEKDELEIKSLSTERNP